jgi:hypothetical protein
MHTEGRVNGIKGMRARLVTGPHKYFHLGPNTTYEVCYTALVSPCA